MLTLPSFAGPTSARSVTRTVRMRFSVGTGEARALLYWLPLAESHLTRCLFGSMLQRARCPQKRRPCSAALRNSGHVAGGFCEVRCQVRRTSVRGGLARLCRRSCLTPEGAKAAAVNGRQIARDVAKHFQSERATDNESGDPVAEEPDEPHCLGQDKLIAVLQTMDPVAFERLCQRILRESGFIEVEVTKRGGDGGIDGFGTIRIAGLISFNVLFQSKRYKGNIGPEVVRDFRGAMVGRADKGMILSTGGFTSEARREATRDGAPPIDLIDGRLLAAKLKELKLGVKTNLVENVEVLVEWFKAI